METILHLVVLPKARRSSSAITLIWLTINSLLLLGGCATTSQPLKPNIPQAPTTPITASVPTITTTLPEPTPVITTTNIPATSAATTIDPYEKYNRIAFKFNMAVDSAVIRPVTVGYTRYIPLPLRYAINNFYNNLRDFVTLANDILQFKGMDTMQNIMRISINTTLGLLGIIDVSSSLGLKMHKNSFGKTFRTYGWKDSNYFVIPILGPSTVRDSVGLIPDIYFNPTWYVIHNNWYSVGLYVVNALDTRSKFLDTDQLIRDSLDPYTTVRDLYLQNVDQKTTAPGTEVNIDELIEEQTKADESNQAQGKENR